MTQRCIRLRPSRRPALTPILLSILLAQLSPTARGQAADVDPRGEWAVEVRDALQLYVAGRCREAWRLCNTLARHSRDPRVLREAEVIRGLCLLGGDTRKDVELGAALVSGAADDDPTLAGRPEVLLAMGVGKATLHETSAALGLLQQAADEFMRRGMSARRAVALAAQARVWAIHNEWPTTPNLQARRPDNADEAMLIRVERIRDLRTRAADLNGGQIALDQIDLTLAQLLMGDAARAGEGRTLLEALAGRDARNVAIAEAKLKLGALREQDGQWTEALNLYRSVAASGLGPAAATAERAAASVTRPQLVIDTPATAPPNVPLPIKLRARNVGAVTLEVRAVDLEGWLTEHQGQLDTSRLPASGALQVRQEYTTRPTRQYDWWQPTDAAMLQAGPGAYVVIASAHTASGHVLESRALVVLSGIQATVVAGARRALVWTNPRARTGELVPNDGRALFWMRGSFVPTRVSIADGMGTFALPGEARVFRDKRWVCLLDVGGNPALCAGQLPPRPGPDNRPTQAIVIGAAAPAPPGSVKRLAGQLLSATGHPANLAGATASLELRDAMDVVALEQPVALDAVGMFDVEVPIGDKLADSVQRVVLRYNGHVLTNVLGRFTFAVTPLDPSPLDVTTTVSPPSEPWDHHVRGQTTARYPWSREMCHRGIGGVIRFLGLPTSADNRPPTPILPAEFHTHGKDSDKGAFDVFLEQLELPPGPMAVGVWTLNRGWDGRAARSRDYELMRAAAPHAWLRHEPADARVGAALRVMLGWFDPHGQTLLQEPVITVRQGTEEIARLSLSRESAGWQTHAWYPPAAGEYELTAELLANNETRLPVRKRISVAAAPEPTSSPLHIEATAVTVEDRHGVRVSLTGDHQGPILLVLRTDEPLAATNVGIVVGAAEVTIAAADPIPQGASVLAVGLGPEGPRILCRARIAPAADRRPVLGLQTPTTEIALGADLHVELSCQTPDGETPDGTVLLRWTAADDGSATAWLPGMPAETVEDASAALTLSGTFATGADEPTPGLVSPPPTLPEAARAALASGATLGHVRLRIVAGHGTARIPLPDEPGAYHVTAWLVTDDGRTADAELLARVRPGVTARVHLPARLTVGDRITAAVRVENSAGAPASARIRLEANDNLDIASRHWHDGEQALVAEDGVLTLELGANESRLLVATVEATRAGPAELRAGLESADKTRVCAASCTVLDEVKPPTPSAATPIVIRRSIWVIESPEIELAGALGQSPDHPQPSRLRLPADAPATAGEYIVIRDEMEVPGRLTDVTWRQRLPATTLSIVFEPQKLLTQGEVSTRRLDELTYTIPNLEAGHCVHEVVVVAARAGACALPPPRIEWRGADVPLVVEPAITRINVRE